MTSKYDTTHNTEGQFQPGSNNEVLLNKLNIINPKEMDDVELDLLNTLTHALLDEVEADQRISVADLREWHRRWLGNVYGWAGELRTVNMGKDGFQFAAAHLLEKLMDTFEKDFLERYTPCEGMGEGQLLEALAMVHIEFILIHPFREGNGRIGRLLATIMALQAGMPPLDFTYLTEHKETYIQAIHAGLLDSRQPMKAVFRRVLQDSVSQSGGD